MPKNYTASLTLNYSPRKTRLIINVIRGKKVDFALSQLTMMNKGKSKSIYNLIRSACSNLNIPEADLNQYFISSIICEEAQKLMRIQPRARGSAFRIRRRVSRVKVTIDKVLLPFNKIDNK